MNKFFPVLVIIILSYTAIVAHEGHDHSHDAPATVAVGQEAEVRSMRIGDYEIMMKNPPLESDQEIAGKIFLTRADTNEPAPNAVVTIIIETASAQTTQIAAAPDKMNGSYSFKIPATSEGEAKLSARFQIGGDVENADLGSVNFAPHVGETAETSNFSSQNLIFGAIGIVVFGAIIALIWFGVSNLRDTPRRVVEIENNVVSV